MKKALQQASMLFGAIFLGISIGASMPAMPEWQWWFASTIATFGTLLIGCHLIQRREWRRQDEMMKRVTFEVVGDITRITVEPPDGKGKKTIIESRGDMRA